MARRHIQSVSNERHNGSRGLECITVHFSSVQYMQKKQKLATVILFTCLSAVGGPHFTAIDDEVIAIFDGIGLEAGDVRTGAHFRHAQTRDIVAGD